MKKIIQEALSEGAEMHVAGQFDLASQLYDSVIKLDPNHADANHNMGLLKVDMGQDLGALPYLQTALQADPGVAQFWLSYIKALIKLDREEEAVRILSLAKESGLEGEEFLELHQKLIEPTHEKEHANQEADTSNQFRSNILDTLKLDKALRLAKSNIKEGSPEEAKHIYQDILDKFPKNKKAQKGLATLNKPRQSIGRQGPPQEIINQLVNLYNQGMLTAVVEQSKNLTQKYPNEFIIWNIMGAANQGLGRVDEAAVAFKKVTGLNTNFPDGYNNLGATLQEQGKLEEAIVAFKKALSLKPNYAEAFNNMGLVLQQQGKLETAIKAYREAISLQPNYAEVYNNLGVLLQRQGKLEEAIDNYNEALKIKPNYAEAFFNIVELLKISLPDGTKENFAFQIDKKVKKIGANLVTSLSDKEIAFNLLEGLDCIYEGKLNFKTKQTQIFKHNSTDLNCGRHFKIFNTKNIIPEFCFSCFKVQVEVDDLFSLIKITRLFYDLKFEEDFTRKTMIETRPNIPGFYKGLIYCQNLAQAGSVKNSVDYGLKEIFGGELTSQIKRGCSEFSMKFPNYGKIINERSTAMDYPSAWKHIEDKFDLENLINPKENLNPSLAGFCLSDFYVIQKWIDYAKGLGDPSAKWFHDLPIAYKEVYEDAMTRRVKYGKTI